MVCAATPGTALVGRPQAAARRPAHSCCAGSGSTNHSSADRIVVNSYSISQILLLYKAWGCYNKIVSTKSMGDITDMSQYHKAGIWAWIKRYRVSCSKYITPCTACHNFTLVRDKPLGAPVFVRRYRSKALYTWFVFFICFPILPKWIFEIHSPTFEWLQEDHDLAEIEQTWSVLGQWRPRSYQINVCHSVIYFVNISTNQCLINA